MSTNTNSTGIKREGWGQLNGRDIYLFTITNSKGNQVKITSYGGIVASWIVQDNIGSKSNIVLGFDSLEGYKAPPPYFGAIIGRYGNRIAKGTFSLEGKEYSLAINNGPNHLHGGNIGFDKVVWDVESLEETSNTIVFHYLSPDGEEGYPGNLDVTVTYSYTDEDELVILYSAISDKSTPVNLTNHSYFNLSGDVSNTILNHSLVINADRYSPVDDTSIPTGELEDVSGGPFDFRRGKLIGQDIAQVEGGYDHNFVLNKAGNELEMAATLLDEASGRQIEVYTTEPGMQFYSGNFLDGSLATSKGEPINKHTGLCLETQHFPNSPNEPAFPSTILVPGREYRSETRYKFAIVKGPGE